MPPMLTLVPLPLAFAQNVPHSGHMLPCPSEILGEALLSSLPWQGIYIYGWKRTCQNLHVVEEGRTGAPTPLFTCYFNPGIYNRFRPTWWTCSEIKIIFDQIRMAHIDLIRKIVMWVHLWVRLRHWFATWGDDPPPPGIWPYLGGGEDSPSKILTVLQSDLIYPNSLVPIKMCSDCETCGLLNHTRGYQDLCSTTRIVRHTD